MQDFKVDKFNSKDLGPIVRVSIPGNNGRHVIPDFGRIAEDNRLATSRWTTVLVIKLEPSGSMKQPQDGKNFYSETLNSASNVFEKEKKRQTPDVGIMTLARIASSIEGFVVVLNLPVKYEGGVRVEEKLTFDGIGYNQRN